MKRDNHYKCNFRRLAHLIIFAIIIAIAVLQSCNLKEDNTETTKSRKEISSEYKWDLSTLCEDSTAWAQDYSKIEAEIEKFAQSELHLENLNIYILHCFIKIVSTMSC